MSDETRRVLDLLAQGKVTVQEAEQLLAALGGGRADSPRQGEHAEEPAPRYLRILVRKAASNARPPKDVNIRVPLSFVRSGLRLGSIIPGFAGQRVRQHLRERGVDLDLAKLDFANLEAMLKEMGELTIDVDDGQAQVRLRCE